MRFLLLFFAVFGCFRSGQTQSYQRYFTGNDRDTLVRPAGGVCLMGGRSEQNDAMRWFMRRAGGGDVLVLRAGGSDGYNDYLYRELGIPVNSVETVVFRDSAAAWDPVIHKKIQRAEAIWFAGGDQWNYVRFWRDTPVDSLINQGIRERNIAVGGTSAGMAILGEIYFSARAGTITSEQALAEPLRAASEVDGRPFLQVPYLENLITDTHYDGRSRMGRHLVFMARAGLSRGEMVRGLACDEYTAVCIEPTGIARVYGQAPEKEDYAYFIQANCMLSTPGPERLVGDQPLHWYRSGKALVVAKIAGTPAGKHFFDLNNWSGGEGIDWEYWSVREGTFLVEKGSRPACLTFEK